MPAKLIDGKELAAKVRAAAGKRAKAFTEKNGYPPGLAVVLVGDNAASHVYVKMKEKACAECGITSFHNELPADVSEKKLLELVEGFNKNNKVHGILVQLPLPEQINGQKVLDAVAPEKDVDGFGGVSLGKLFSGNKGFVPATPKGVMKLIDSTGIDLKGKKAVVVGRSNIVGKPVSMLLLERHCTLEICHSRTKDLGAETRQADVLVVAVGKAGLITKEMVKPGALVIDVGINRTDAGIVGDCAKDVAEVAGWLTPVPRGVGPMTVASLMDSTVEAAEKIAEGKK